MLGKYDAGQVVCEENLSRAHTYICAGEIYHLHVKDILLNNK